MKNMHLSQNMPVWKPRGHNRLAKHKPIRLAWQVVALRFCQLALFFLRTLLCFLKTKQKKKTTKKPTAAA